MGDLDFRDAKGLQGEEHPVWIVTSPFFAIQYKIDGWYLHAEWA